MATCKPRKFGSGGTSHSDVALDKKIVKKAVGMHDKQMHGGKKTDMSALKKGGNVKKMAFGGPAAGGPRPMPGPAAGAPRPMPGPAGAAPRPMPGPAGGPRPMPGRPMAKGGLAAGHKSADGIAKKGKTKARAVAMKKGGKC